MSEIVAWRYRWQHDTKWVHTSEEPEAYPNRIVEPLCVAGGEDQLRDALRSISRNTCCDGCQEAALVAREALEGRSNA